MRSTFAGLTIFLALSGCDTPELPEGPPRGPVAIHDGPEPGTLAPGDQIYDPPIEEPPARPLYIPQKELSATQRARLTIDPTGTYRRQGDWGRAVIRSSGDMWEVEIDADPPQRGDRCSLLTVGPLSGDRIVARAVASAGRFADQAVVVALQSAEMRLIVDVKRGAVQVTDRGAFFPICGLPPNLDGRYVRID